MVNIFWFTFFASSIIISSSLYFRKVAKDEHFLVSHNELSETRPASDASTELLTALSTQIRDQFIEKTKLIPERFLLIAYRERLGTGTSKVLAKVQISQDEYAHLSIFQPFAPESDMELIDVQLGQSLYSEIKCFSGDDGSGDGNDDSSSSSEEVDD